MLTYTSMAYHEMRLILAKLLYTFDLQLCSEIGVERSEDFPHVGQGSFILSTFTANLAVAHYWHSIWQSVPIDLFLTTKGISPNI